MRPAIAEGSSARIPAPLGESLRILESGILTFAVDLSSFYEGEGYWIVQKRRQGIDFDTVLYEADPFTDETLRSWSDVMSVTGSQVP